MVHPAMWNKAQALIASDADSAHRAMGCCYPGARYRKHRPYMISGRADALVKALGSGDPNRVGTIMLDWERL